MGKMFVYTDHVWKDIHVDITTKTIILKSVRKTTDSVGLWQDQRSDLPGRLSCAKFYSHKCIRCICVNATFVSVSALYGPRVLIVSFGDTSHWEYHKISDLKPKTMITTLLPSSSSALTCGGEEGNCKFFCLETKLVFQGSTSFREARTCLSLVCVYW